MEGAGEEGISGSEKKLRSTFHKLSSPADVAESFVRPQAYPSISPFTPSVPHAWASKEDFPGWGLQPAPLISSMRTLSISLMNSCPFFHLSFPPKGAQLSFQISLPRSLWSSPISRNCHWRFFSNPNSSSISKNPRSVSCSFPSSSVSPPLAGDDFEVELSRLLVLLPEEMCRKVREHAELHHLIEIVMDLGRKPLARFPSGDFLLSDRPITRQDLQHATSQVGDFASDNRAGISRTLHRISAIRNRKGVIIGLTCRVGRAITGSATLLRDLVKDGDSLLLIGPPGVGKTTIIREISRMLANDYRKRVMIVDTSNEIGGDGDIPHEGIGGARRMQVPVSDMQHKILIEAVENHMPQVIVIDEIGTKLEAMAASTIAQRGIQLVATAHGVSIENLIANPSLEMLVGGIQSVTLGDEAASRRGGQKTVLERKGPSTFTSGVEIISKLELRVHRSLEATVDCLLSGRAPNYEVRQRKTKGGSHKTHSIQDESLGDVSDDTKDEHVVADLLETNEKIINNSQFASEIPAGIVESSLNEEVAVRLYVYGILETSVVQVINQLGIDTTIKLTDNISEADGLLSSHSKLKKNLRIHAVAKSRGIPIYVTKTSSLLQIRKAIRAFINKHNDVSKDFETEDKMISSEKIDALEEARLAIEQIVIPQGEPVELLPRSTHIMSLQIDLIRKYQLQFAKLGKESDLRLRVLPLHTKMERSSSSDGTVETGIMFEDLSDLSENDGLDSITQLPLLPD